MINKRLKEIRKYFNLTQPDLADRLDVPLHLINSIEYNKQRMPVDFAERLYETFNINLTWLISGKGQMFMPEISDETKSETPEYKPPEITVKIPKGFKVNIEYE